MSEEIAETSEATQQSENVSHETNDNNQETRSKPAGYDPVDLSDLPPEKAQQVEERINYLYRQVKDTGKNIREYRSIAEQQAQLIEDLRNGVGMVVDHLENKTFQENEATLRQKMENAFEAGDLKGYHEAQDKLQDLKLQKLTKPQPQKKTETQKQAYAGKVSASSMAQEAVQDGELDPQDATFVSAWQQETNDRGEPLRPWTTTADPNDPDPDFVKALVITKKVWDQYPNRSIKENLAEIDKRMGVQTRSSGQTVMGGSLTTQGKNSKITLSAKQQEIAVRTKFAGPKAKSDADHIAAYRKQLEKVQASQRSR
jgi:hypothetical protein